MATLTAREVLNHLIETCTDADRGFRAAATLVTAPELKKLLLAMASERAQFATELLPHAQRLGGAATSDGTTAGTWHRHWMDFKKRMSPHNDHAIVVEVERGNALSLQAYTDAVNNLLPPSTRDLIEQQRAEVMSAHERLEKLRGATST